MDNRQVAGTLLFTGAVEAILGIHLAEFFYPGYSVSMNVISDLGATCNGTCVIHQPSAIIFNTSVILLGLIMITASYFIWREFHSAAIAWLFVLSGIGAIGVGVFPETAGMVHVVFSLITFLFGGLAAIAAHRLVKEPFSYFCVIMGAMTLAALVLYGSDIYLGLGPGGMERMIAYPVLLWGTGFGGYLMSS